MRPVLRRNPKAKLKYDETEDGNCSVTIFRILGPANTDQRADFKRTYAFEKKKEKKVPYIFWLETKRGAQDNSKESEPTQAVADVFWETKEGPLDKGNPDCFDGTRDDCGGDEPEGDNGDERPCKEGLHYPSVAGRVEDGGRNPPSEDEASESKELQTTNEAVVSGKP